MRVIQMEAFVMPMQKKGTAPNSELQFLVIKHSKLGYLVEPALLRLPLTAVLKRVSGQKGVVFMVNGKELLPIEWLKRKRKRKLAGIDIKYTEQLIEVADQLFPHRWIEVECHEGV